MAAFVGFYVLLFTFLMVRAFVQMIGARMKRAAPAAVKNVSQRVGVARRAWTDAVERTNFSPRVIERPRRARVAG